MRRLFRRSHSHRPLLAAAAVLGALLGMAVPEMAAHGFAGQRFFPPTIQTDDPFVADELAFPTMSTFRDAGDPVTRETDVGINFSKQILPGFSLGLSHAWVKQQPNGLPTVTGLQNLALSAKYQAGVSEPHEAIVSFGAEWEIGGTGARRVGADKSSTVTPMIFFGKGLGDLPDRLTYLRPIAVTGAVGVTFPHGDGANTMQWGFALEYSLPYLQSFVKDVGLGRLFRNMIPLVEFAFQTPLNHGSGRTTGTINPGVLWSTRRFQIGGEAVIPANGSSGRGVGVAVQVQYFIDDLFPRWFGHPIWGGR